MPEFLEETLERMNQLQIAFLAKLGDKVKKLSRLILQLDTSVDIKQAGENQDLLKNINQLAHNLAGSAGTFKHTAVYHKAKAIENLTSELLHKPTADIIPNWHKLLLELIVGLRGDVQISGRPSIIENFSFVDFPNQNEQTPEDNSNPCYPIIVVDDDELLVTLIKEQAKYFDYDVISLLSTADLEQAIDEYQPEAILIDVVFPDAKHSGIEIINQLKAQKKINCPVVFMSNRCDIIVRLDALRAGSDAFVVKPLDILELIRILDRLTQKLAKTKSKLLVVDDDALTAKFYQTAFAHENFLCEAVINPMEVIDKALAFNPDAILLDINMPGCNGFELAKIIRQDNNFAHIPILFLTARSSDEREIYAMNSGGDDFLDKNAELSTLIAIIKGHVQRYKELNSVLNRLKKDEILFRSITSSSSDAIISVDSKSRIVFWNEGAENIFGYRAIETIGQCMELIIPSDQRECFSKLVAGKTPLPSKYAFETTAVKKDNTVIEVELTYTQLIAGNENFYTTIIRDITHKKHLEQELYNKEASLNAIINSSGEAIITADSQGIIETANPKATQLFGYNLEELIGQNVSMLVFPSEKLAFHQYVQQITSSNTEKLSAVAELHGLHRDGHIFAIELNISLMRISGQQKFVGILHDISERKQFINELLLTKAAAESASKAKTQFLSSMSHELRTPLNAILGFTQLLQTDADSPLNKEQLELLDYIYDSGTHLLALINEVLDLAKIDSGALELHIEKFALVEFINEIIKQLFPLVNKANLTINTLNDDGTIFVESDKAKLGQVINHLFSNAIKYNKPGGTITAELTTTADKVRLLITDTGNGIPEHLLPHLFKPFSRLGAEIGTIAGTGVGLTLSKKLLEMLHGTVGVTSKVNQGSTFWIELNKAN
jgi:PAS domain S-box-containing protein